MGDSITDGFLSLDEFASRWRISVESARRLVDRKMIEGVLLPAKRGRFVRLRDVEDLEHAYRGGQPIDPIADTKRREEAREALAMRALAYDERMVESLSVLLEGELGRDRKFNAESVASWLSGAVAEVRAIQELGRKPLAALSAVVKK